MKSKIYVLSDKVLRGEKSLDFSKLSKLLLSYGITVSQVNISSIDKGAGELSSSSFLFLDDDNIDDFISKNRIFYDTKSEIIDGEAVVAGKDFPVAVFPIEGDLVKLVGDVLELCKHRFNLDNILIFRLFGKSLEDVKDSMKELNLEGEYFLSGSGLLCDIYLKKGKDREFISENEIKINDKFGENIYSQSSLDMSEVVAKMLTFSDIKLSIFDAFTAGELAKDLLSKTESKRIVSSTFAYKTESDFVKVIEPEKNFKDASDMTYQMAYSALEKADISVVVAGERLKNTYKIYISLGRKKSIDVFNLTVEGSKEDAVTLAKYTAIFNLIKKLRVKDFEK